MLTYLATGKYFGRYYFGYPHFEHVRVFRLKVGYLQRRQFTWVLSSGITG